MAVERHDQRSQGTAKRHDTEQPARSEREQRDRDTGRGPLARRAPSGPGFFHDPFSMMNTLHDEIDRLFGSFGGGLLRSPLMERGAERSLWSPQIEMFERDGRLVVSADLPGMTRDDVKVELNENVLTIEGERKHAREEKGFSERRYGRFFRSITLPDGVSGENATASFKDGVLEITMDAPKREHPRGRRIDIR